VSSSSQDSRSLLVDSNTNNNDPTCTGRKHRRHRKRQLQSNDNLLSPVVENDDDNDYLRMKKTKKQKKKNNAEASSPSASSTSEVVAAEEERLSFHLEEDHQQQHFLTKKEATPIVPNDDDNNNDNNQNQNGDHDNFSLLPSLPLASLSPLPSSLTLMARKVCDKLPQLSWTDKNDDDMPLFRLIASESLTRIIQGKDPNGGEETSCMRNYEDDTNTATTNATDHHVEEGNGSNAAKATTTTPSSPVGKETTTTSTMTEEEREQLNNPLFVTNQLLLNSGALPVFATTMHNVLDQYLKDCCLHNKDSKSDISPTIGGTAAAALFYHRRQISTFASLLDCACLFSDQNREELCSNGLLIPGLLRVLNTAATATASLMTTAAMDSSGNGNDNGRGERKNWIELDILLVCLRTLTSLTHDNDLSGQQITQQQQQQQLCNSSSSSSSNNQGKQQPFGTEIILSLLYQMVELMEKKNNKKIKQEEQNPMMKYSNNNNNGIMTLTNIVESANLPDLLSTYLIPPKGEQQSQEDDKLLPSSSYLLWLTKWVISETDPFRASVMNESFGKTGNKDDKYYFDSKVEEHIVTAGNGFIFLACLMVKASSLSSSLSSPRTANTNCSGDKICQSILLQMPQPPPSLPSDVTSADFQITTNNNGGSERYTLMMNTLRSFCNLYYYSVGDDLSVAVLTPVKRLLEELEIMKIKALSCSSSSFDF